MRSDSPSSTFRSSDLRVTDEGDVTVEGEITIKGVTKPIVLSGAVTCTC